MRWPELRELCRFSDHMQPINHIAFSPEGHLVTSAGDDGKVSLHHTPTRAASAGMESVEVQSLSLVSVDKVAVR
jgi:WD40 repeat protein